MKHTSILTLLLCSIFFHAGIAHAYGEKGLRVFRTTTNIPVDKTAANLATEQLAVATMEAMPSVGLSKYVTADNPFSKNLVNADQVRRRCVAAYNACIKLGEAVDAGSSVQQYISEHPRWHNFIEDEQFIHHLNNAILSDSYDRVMTEMVQYYGLDGETIPSMTIPPDVFAAAAVSYAVAHHQKNLQLQLLLDSFYLSRPDREAINAFLKKKKLSEEEQESFFNLLERAYTDYVKYVEEDLSSAWTVMAEKIYRETADAVLAFTKQAGRFPRENSAPEERKLALAVNLLLSQAAVRNYQPVSTQMQRLLKLHMRYPTEVWTKEIFAQEYEKFLRKHPDETIPPAWHEDWYTEWDAMLYETYQHYRRTDKDWTLATMQAVQDKVRPELYTVTYTVTPAD